MFGVTVSHMQHTSDHYVSDAFSLWETVSLASARDGPWVERAGGSEYFLCAFPYASFFLQRTDICPKFACDQLSMCRNFVDVISHVRELRTRLHLQNGDELKQPDYQARQNFAKHESI